MPVKPPYTFIQPDTKPSGRTRWILAGLALALLGWLWWRSERASQYPSPKAEFTETNALRGSTPANKFNSETQRTNAVLKSSRDAAPQQVSATNNQVDPSSASRVFELQLALAQRGISPGSIDGLFGPQTRAALRAFQQKENLPVTGELDAATRLRLVPVTPLYTNYIVSTGDLARLLPLGATWLAKSQQERLDYETVLELAGEKGHAHPNLIRTLNPHLNWSNVLAGTAIQIPQVEYPPVLEKAAFLRIRLAERVLQGFGANSNLLVHFPCSIAQRMDKRPVGELRVAVLAPNPNYTFDPEVFPESAEARELGRKLILQPGPNNPVGTVWIGLDRPGYGIHGTPRPEQVGRTESHGCFRLANWNAEYLLKLVWLGMPVFIEP